MLRFLFGRGPWGGLVCRDVGGALTAIPVAYYAFMVIVGFIIIAWEKFQR